VKLQQELLLDRQLTQRRPNLRELLLLAQLPARRAYEIFQRGTAPKLPDDDVTAVLRIGDTTWIGTRGGLARIPTLRAD